MTKEHAMQALGQIESMFGREYPKKFQASILSSLEAESSDAMILAIKIMENKAMLHESLPAPIGLLKLVRECAAAKADKDHDKRVRENRNTPFENLDPLGFRIFQAMTRLIFSGKNTRKQILDKLREADKAKPGCGWDLCGADLQRLYERKKLRLDSPPASGILNLSFDGKGDVYE